MKRKKLPSEIDQDLIADFRIYRRSAGLSYAAASRIVKIDVGQLHRIEHFQSIPGCETKGKLAYFVYKKRKSNNNESG